jgi:hypothetical protein
MTLEEAKALRWDTYGKGGLAEHVTYGTPLPELVEKTLGNLETEHLESILATQKQITVQYVDAIMRILESREDADKSRLRIRRRDAIAATKAQVSSEEADKKGEGRD